MGVRLGARHAEGRGVREGAPPAPRGKAAGAGSGRGGDSDDLGPRAIVGSSMRVRCSLGMG